MWTKLLKLLGDIPPILIPSGGSVSNGKGKPSNGRRHPVLFTLLVSLNPYPLYTSSTFSCLYLPNQHHLYCTTPLSQGLILS